eukprot:gene14174-19019_t
MQNACLAVFLLLQLLCWTDCAKLKVVVAGATGYIGRQVVQELVSRGIPTMALVRSLNITPKTAEFLKGAELSRCDVLDPEDVTNIFQQHQPSAVICCLASRSGIKNDAWAVDYGASYNLLKSLETVSNNNKNNNNADKGHYVLLSAFCCGKPLLQFQFAKLKLEEELMKSAGVMNSDSNDAKITYSIVRPTAFFKSLDGQFENVKKNLPTLYFGDGTCSANAISEKDLAKYLVNCALKPSSVNMVNQCRDVGGPDVPPITKANQIKLIYDTLGVPDNKRWTISIPLGIFTFMSSTFENFQKVFHVLKNKSYEKKCDDALEILRIIQYYATEPMVATEPDQIQGTIKLKDHFERIVRENDGNLEDIDKMTTTTGVLEIFARDEYAK